MKKDLTLSTLFFVALMISSISIILSFPAENGYMTTADEGAYFRQAQKINEQGWSGFEALANDYIKNPDSQVYPSPVRIGYIMLASIALKFSNSFHALSTLSLLLFVLQAIASFFFLRRHWGIYIATIGGILICFSPLGWSLARRALSDPASYLFLSLTLFAFIDYIRWNRVRDVILFIISFSFSILIKESAVLFLPFFAILLCVYKFYYEKNIKILSLGLMIIGPLIICTILYVFTLGSIGNIIQIAEIINNLAVTHPQPYVIRYHSGPWYQIFIDLFMISPFVSIFCLMYVGYYFIGTERKNEQLNLLLLFGIYFIILYSSLPKNVRWAQTIDMTYRICAALFIVDVAGKIISSVNLKKAVTIFTMLLILAVDVKAYYNDNITYDIYDPTCYNLLQARHIIFGVGEVPLEQTYLTWSYYYYSKGNFQKCIEEAQKAISINPNFAAAYNNICSAYNNLKDWDHAIEAGKRAVEVDPNNQLARNNLNWAISQKASGK